MRKLIRNIFIVTLITLSFVGGRTFAQTDTTGDYVTLAPLPNTTENCGADVKVGDACTTTLQKYLPAVFNLSIGIAAVMAFVMITFGGITYVVSDSISGKADGRKYIENALYGLVLVIGAYAILYTINPAILEFNLNLKKPNVITEPTVTAGGVTGTAMTSAELSDDQTVRSQLVGVSVNHSPCTQGETQGCTNLNGLPSPAISGVNSLAATCSCAVTITGGTEGGHATHGAGAAVVDLSPTSSLNSFLSKTNPQASNPTGQPSPTVVKYGGATYTYENQGDNGRANAPHWHVSF